MSLSKYITTSIIKFNENRDSIYRADLPKYLYHVTTNYEKVISSGVLLAMSGLKSGGLGGTESFGVSFTKYKDIAQNICDELSLINDVNNSVSEEDLFNIIQNITDSERKDFILEEYKRTLSVYNNFRYAALMALRLTRNSNRFIDRPYHGLIIFHEENIKNKDIGIIKINTNDIPKDLDIIDGVDKDLGEIRILGDIKL